MHMTISTQGLGELDALLAKLGAKAQDVASGSLFEGAGVVGDAFTGAINSILTEPFKYAGPGKTRLPTPEEKAAPTMGGFFAYWRMTFTAAAWASIQFRLSFDRAR